MLGFGSRVAVPFRLRLSLDRCALAWRICAGRRVGLVRSRHWRLGAKLAHVDGKGVEGILALGLEGSSALLYLVL